MRRSLIVASSLALAFSGLTVAPAFAVSDGLINCVTDGAVTGSGTFTIQNNVVIDRNACTGRAIIPDGVTGIGNYAFYQTPGLTSITIPSSVTTIGTGAFGYASGLTSISISSSVTTIGNSAFTPTTSLTAISVDVGNSNYKSTNGVLFNKSGLTVIHYPAGLNATTYTIPSSVTTIGTYAFYSATRLTSIAIPSSVTTIGSDAFNAASGLTSITIPSSVTTIEEAAFSNTTSLRAVTFEPGSELTIIGSYAFNGTTSLTSIEIPASVVTIDEDAFDGASALTSVTFELGSRLSTIADWAFYGASSLPSITIPSSVTAIGDGAFYATSSLTSIYFLGNAPATGGMDVFTGAGDIVGSTAYIKSTSTGFPSVGSLWNGLTVAIGVYEARYNPNGGSTVTASSFVRNGSIASAPTAPTRSGYTFAGWSATDGGIAVTFPYSLGVNADTTLFAKWTLDAAPAASTAAAITQPTKSLRKSIQFSTSSKLLTKAHKATLKKSVAASGAGATYVVTGTAGFLPGATESQVKKLAKVRANVVKAYLVKLGVNKADITIKIKTTNQGFIPKTKTLARYLTS
jgi:uncharacterized repeat protein (TIGR02543 family)